MLSKISDIARSAAGRWHVAARLDGAWICELEADTQVRAASTVKLAVLLAAIHAVESDRLRWDSPIPLPELRVGESGVLADLPGVHRLPLREMLSLMVTVSDNDATNAVIAALGLDAVNASAARAGASRTVLGRAMMDGEAVAAGRDNLTCARDQVLLVQALTASGPGGPDAVGAGEIIIGAESAGYARAMLARQQINDRIPALLPSGTAVLHKTGDLDGIYHDTGVIVLPDGRELALSVLGTQLSPDAAHTAGDTIARIARVVYESLAA